MNSQQKGISLMLLSSLCFSLMAVSVKLLPDIPTYEKIFFRNFTGLIISFFIIKSKNQSFIGNNKKLLILRSTFGLLGVAAYFYSISKLPLANSAILNKLSPIFVLIFASLILGEKIKKLQIPALIISVFGIALVIKPGINTNFAVQIIGLSSAVFAGMAYTVVRKLREYDSPETIVFYFCLLSSLAMLPFFVTEGFVMPTPRGWISAILLGIFATLAQLSLTKAYRHAPAGELSIYSYSNIIFSAIIGLILWNEIPDSLSIIGGILIILGGYINYICNKPQIKKVRVTSR